LAKKKYHKSAGWMPWIEVLLGIYFSGAVLYSVQNANYLTVPFLLLFVWGYLYTGVMSLAQTYVDRLRSGAKELPAAAPIAAPVATAATESSASD
jgi:hypothetical protein